MPIKLAVSDQPLFVKVQLANNFPQAPPVIQVMAKVAHPRVDPNTYNYILAQPWNERSSLTTIMQALHEDFKQQPPLPQSSQPGAPQAPEATVAPVQRE